MKNKQLFSIIVAILMVTSLFSCANPRGSAPEAGGAGAGIGNETKAETPVPSTPLPKEYEIKAQSYSTADADAFMGLYRLAERIVDECDSVTFPADLIVLPEGYYATAIYAGTASAKGAPYAFEVAHARGTALDKRDAFQQTKAGTVTLQLKELAESDKEWTAHLLFLAMIGQDTASYCHVAADPIIAMRVGKHNDHPDWAESLYVCTEYAKYGYSSISEYRIAVDEGRAPDRDDIYTVGLEDARISTVTNLGTRANTTTADPE